MYQAIVTKYLPPTNTKGGRVKAQCDAGSVVIEWDPTKDSDENHALAAKALVVRLGWQSRRWLRGSLPGASKWLYCYVQTTSSVRGPTAL